MFILSIKRQSHNPGGNQVHATDEISERKQRKSFVFSFPLFPFAADKKEAVEFK